MEVKSNPKFKICGVAALRKRFLDIFKTTIAVARLYNPSVSLALKTQVVKISFFCRNDIPSVVFNSFVMVTVDLTRTRGI
jgi:predicted membrane-bound mannosyltransferase